MDLAAFQLMASHEERHWWFVGRRAVIGAILDRVRLPAQPTILEAGCGTGGNLYMLEQRGSVSAFEPSDAARDLVPQLHRTTTIADGELPFRIPYPDGSFDLVVALDVLEHVDDDRAAMGALVKLARPEGAILVTVPAHSALWGSHDRRLHHRRRYGRDQLRSLASGHDAAVEFFTAFNTLLAPLAVTLRLAERVIPVNLGNQEQMPNRWANGVLSSIFATEARFIRRRALAAGLSYAMVLRRGGFPRS